MRSTPLTQQRFDLQWDDIRRPSMLPRRTARAPMRKEARNAVGMEAGGIPAPIPAARLSMERAAPRANASVGESMASLFLSAVSASL